MDNWAQVEKNRFLNIFSQDVLKRGIEHLPNNFSITEIKY